MNYQTKHTEGDLTQVQFRWSANPVITAAVRAPACTVVNQDKVRALA